MGATVGTFDPYELGMRLSCVANRSTSLTSPRVVRFRSTRAGLYLLISLVTDYVHPIPVSGSKCRRLFREGEPPFTTLRLG